MNVDFPGLVDLKRSELSNDADSAFEHMSDRIDQWRTHIDQYLNPVMVMDTNFWPILLNRVLRKLMVDPTPVTRDGVTTASVWQEVCETAGRIALESCSQSTRQFAKTFTVHDKQFVAIGSLPGTSNSRIAGALLNISEIQLPSGLRDDQHRINDNPVQRSNDEKDEFHRWRIRRDEAQAMISRLSRRESEVAALVAEGYSTKQIAKELGVGSKTIEKHRANAVLKVGARNSAELVRITAVAGHELPAANPRDEIRFEPHVFSDGNGKRQQNVHH